MDLIERYLQAVRFWLPAPAQDDLLAELAEDLRSQREEAEARLGRALDRQETADLLRRAGPPMTVASRYLQQTPLLRPDLAMLYRFAVKFVLVWILLPVNAILLLPRAFLSSHPLAEVAGAIGSYLTAAVFTLGVLTLVFAALDRITPRPWDPLTLPPVRGPRDPKPVPRHESALELGFGLLFAAWWTEAFGRAALGWSTGSGPIWASGPLWQALHGPWFMPVLVLCLGTCAIAALCLARPQWARLKLAWGAVNDALVSAICWTVLLLHRPEALAGLGVLRGANRSAQDPAVLAAAGDAALGIALLTIAVICLVSALVRGTRLLRAGLSPAPTSPAPR